MLKVLASVMAVMLGRSTDGQPLGVFCSLFSAVTSLSARAVVAASARKTVERIVFFIILYFVG